MSAAPLFMIIGPVALTTGIAMMIVAIRSGGVGTVPKSTAMLIAGMTCAFGILLTAFAIAGRAPVPQGA